MWLSAQVDWAAVPWGKELLVSKDKLPLMGSNDAIVNRPEALTPVSFGDDLLRNAMSEVSFSVCPDEGIGLPHTLCCSPVSLPFWLLLVQHHEIPQTICRMLSCLFRQRLLCSHTKCICY